MAIKLIKARHVEQSMGDQYYSPALADFLTVQNTLQVTSAEEQADIEKAPAALPLVQDDSTAADLPTANLNLEQWLPFAAQAYNISPNISDYFFRSAPLFITDLPNRNGVAFPAKELAKWSIEGGCQAYQTWRGKPMHVEHQDEDPTQAIGVIVDVAMVPLNNFADNKLWKVVALFALDRTKNPKITGAIERGERNTYSMGCVVEGYTCSYCGAEVGKCSHTDPEDKLVFYELNGKLVYKMVWGVEGREFSSVGDPAFGSAVSDFDGHISLK